MASTAHAWTEFRALDDFRQDRSLFASIEEPYFRGIRYSPVIDRTPVIDTEFFSWALSFQGSYTYTNSTPVKLLQTDAFTNSLLRQSDGIQLASGSWGTLGVDSDMRIFEILNLRHQLFFRPRASRQSFESSSYFYARDFYADLKLNALNLQAGKIAIRWGPGRIQNLVFSGEHEPFWMVRLTNSESVELPGFLRPLGDMKFDFFWTKLDDSQTLPGAHFLASFFSLMPHRRLEIGFGQTVIFGGEGATTQNPLVFLSEGLVSNSQTNRNFILTARWNIPKLNIEPYAEMMTEDCCGKRPWDAFSPRNNSHLIGLFLPSLGNASDLDLTFEWLRTSHIAYRHGVYTSGYVYKHRTLGPSLGPDGNGLYARLRYFAKNASILSLTFSHEIRSKTGEASSIGDAAPIETVEPSFQAPEQRTRIELGYGFKVKPTLECLFGAGLEHVLNRDYQKYSTKSFVSGTVGLRQHL